MAALTIIVLLLGFLQVSRGSNVLIFSGYGEGSHFMSAALVGKELMRRGHNVTAIISNAYEYRANESRYKDFNFEIFKHNVPPEEVRLRRERSKESIFNRTLYKEVNFVRSSIMNRLLDDCQALFDDKPLLRRLLQAKFDVAFINPIWPCSLLVAEYAAKRHVSFMATTWMNNVPRLNGNPSNTAFVPEWSTGFTNKMTFIQRVINNFAAMLSVWITSSSDSHTAIQHANGICPDLWTSQLYQRSQLLLLNVDFALEFPVPVMPHLIPVGGLSTGPADDLSKVSIVQ
ncbi:UDP-glucuronosyltransferase 1-6-like [Lytechinus pictus]|uniref:UDP-glucuronosyltransferase 1-6-like n=1 Tax=Lytechinus pictus TaxID=7653 RepID=UPI0030B9DBFB